jgi:hypothetical protein
MHKYVNSGQYARDVQAQVAKQSPCPFCGHPYYPGAGERACVRHQSLLERIEAEPDIAELILNITKKARQLGVTI